MRVYRKVPLPKKNLSSLHHIFSVPCLTTHHQILLHLTKANILRPFLTCQLNLGFDQKICRLNLTLVLYICLVLWSVVQIRSDITNVSNLGIRINMDLLREYPSGNCSQKLECSVWVTVYSNYSLLPLIYFCACIGVDCNSCGGVVARKSIKSAFVLTPNQLF